MAARIRLIPSTHPSSQATDSYPSLLEALDLANVINIGLFTVIVLRIYLYCGYYSSGIQNYIGLPMKSIFQNIR